MLPSQVHATDAAGNSDAGHSVRWSGTFQAGRQYTRTASAPPPLTNRTALSFAVYSFRGGGPDAPPVLLNATGRTVRYALVPVPDDANPSAAADGAATAAPSGDGGVVWTTAVGPSIVASVPTDGLYRFLAGVVAAPAVAASGGNSTAAAASGGNSTPAASGGNGTAVPPPPGPEVALATALVRVDTVPPALQVVSGPAALQASPVVTVQFQTLPPNDGVAFFCRWEREVWGGSVGAGMCGA